MIGALAATTRKAPSIVPSRSPLDCFIRRHVEGDGARAALLQQRSRRGVGAAPGQTDADALAVQPRDALHERDGASPGEQPEWLVEHLRQGRGSTHVGQQVGAALHEPDVSLPGSEQLRVLDRAGGFQDLNAIALRGEVDAEGRGEGLVHAAWLAGCQSERLGWPAQKEDRHGTDDERHDDAEHE
jgi:hypothetical protein